MTDEQAETGAQSDDGFVFLVPDEDAQPTEAPASDEELERQSLPFKRNKKAVEITPKQLEGFWKDRVVKLTDTIATAETQSQPKGFHVDEISFGLAISASGGVAFVAQGSIEASLNVTLRR